MTATLAPGLLMGSAPPANAPPGPQTSRASSKATSGGTGDEAAPGSFASLLQTATEQGAGTQAGGEPVSPPSSGTPASEGTPTAADLLAQLMALAQGVGAEGESSDAAIETSTNLLLDRLAEAGGTEDQTGGAAGVVEALMAYLVMGQPRQVEPDAVTAVPGDLGALLQGIEDALSGTATDAGDVQQAIGGTAAELPAGLTGAMSAATGSTSNALASSAVPVTEGAADTSEIAADAAADLGADVAASVAPVTGTLEDGGELAAGRQPARPAATGESLPVTPQPVTASTSSATQVASGETASAVKPAVEDARDVDVTPATSAQASANATAEAAAAMASQPAQQPSMAPSRIDVMSAAPATEASLPVEVADIVQTASLNGDSEVRLVLNPPELGHLDIHITRGEHGLRITLEAAQSGARDLIDRSMAGLHQALEARDLRVDRLEVRSTDTGRGSLDTSAGGQHPGGGFSGSQGEDTPEWSPVAMFERMNEAAQPQQPDTTTATATASGMVAGSVNVLA